MSTDLQQLDELASLRERGHISEAEYESLKKQIIDNFRPASSSGPSPLPPAETSEPPEAPIAFAIISTFFGFLPFGIVAIVKACRVSGLWYSGRRDEAVASAESSEGWAKASLLLTLVVFVVLGLISGRSCYQRHYGTHAAHEEIPERDQHILGPTDPE